MLSWKYEYRTYERINERFLIFLFYFRLLIQNAISIMSYGESDSSGSVTGNICSTEAGVY